MKETDANRKIRTSTKSNSTIARAPKNHSKSRSSYKAHSERRGMSASATTKHIPGKLQLRTHEQAPESEPVLPVIPISPVTVTSSQLITPNPNISCTPGWCLEYVRETFGIGPKLPTATAGWNASTRKHSDQNFPVGIWVPVWFSLKSNPDGHVALRQPDGSIWSSSSPTSTTPVHHSSIQDLLKYYNNKLTYLGWTEDIEDVLIMDGLNQPAIKQAETIRVLAKPMPPVI